MKNKLAPFIGIFVMLLGMAAMFLAFSLVSWLFGQGWELSDTSKQVCGFVGFVFGIACCIWYFEND